MEIQLYHIKEKPCSSFFHAKNLEQTFFSNDNNNNTIHKHNSTRILGKRSKLLRKTNLSIPDNNFTARCMLFWAKARGYFENIFPKMNTDNEKQA